MASVTGKVDSRADEPVDGRAASAVAPSSEALSSFTVDRRRVRLRGHPRVHLAIEAGGPPKTPKAGAAGRGVYARPCSLEAVKEVSCQFIQG